MMRKFLLAATLFLVIRCAFADEAIAPRYEITNLTPGSSQNDFYSEANGVNNKGEVVGMTNGRAFLWRDGKLKLIGRLPNSTSSRATNINDIGQIVGTCSFGEDNKYFFWQNRKMQDLGDAPWLSHQIKLNNAGQVLLANAGTKGSALWQNNKRKNIGSWSASDINNNGQIVGGREVLGTPADIVSWRRRRHSNDAAWAVVWENGLEVSVGKNGSMATLINDKRNIVIMEGIYLNFSHMRYFLSGNGRKIELLSSDNKLLLPCALNNQNQIIGSRFDENQKDFIWVLWQDGHAYDLKTLIPENSGWEITALNDINDSGQIVGEGTCQGAQRAFLLTPIPTASN